ncbi:MAG TPA: sialidase family protein [Acidobacteriota bacterium]|nr:sialidase family protein [Acidobacteriota bacterium]
MTAIEVLESGVIFENPLPQLRSRQAFFPSLVRLEDGTLLASYALGEAFESIDQTTHLSSSSDLGRTWTTLGPVHDKDRLPGLTSDVLKVTSLGGNRLVAFGYRFCRRSADLPLGNPETGGLQDSEMILLRSFDGGRSWSNPEVIPRSFPDPVEASAPITVLSNGDWVSPIANFFNWEGNIHDSLHGRLIRSTDEGRTWEDTTITMRFSDPALTVWEQRLCEMEGGKVVVIAWNEDLKRNRLLPNHFALSLNHGRDFATPQSTGIYGQASSVQALGDDLLLALHCLRRDTERPGIYGCIVDLRKGQWDIVEQSVIWEPHVPIQPDKHFAQSFSYLKFGQPSAITLPDGTLMMVHWAIVDGQGKILYHRLRIRT